MFTPCIPPVMCLNLQLNRRHQLHYYPDWLHEQTFCTIDEVCLKDSGSMGRGSWKKEEYAAKFSIQSISDFKDRMCVKTSPDAGNIKKTLTWTRHINWKLSTGTNIPEDSSRFWIWTRWETYLSILQWQYFHEKAIKFVPPVFMTCTIHWMRAWTMAQLNSINDLFSKCSSYGDLWTWIRICNEWSWIKKGRSGKQNQYSIYYY